MSSTLGGFMPGRLWSLWDMFQISAHTFVEALNWLAHLDNMAKRKPISVYGNASNLDLMTKYAEKIITELELLQLPLSVKKARQIALHLDLHLPEVDSTDETTHGSRAGIITHALEELRERIAQELEERIVYCVNLSNSSLLKEKDKPFGNSVADKFPDASSDISEAAICLGMARPTAAVFHLMRAMEIGVKQLGEKLNATIIDKNDKVLDWGIILANMKVKIEALSPGDNRDDLSAAHGLLYHVKQAWRNTTMHPKQTYTEEEARSIFDAVRSFMRHLAGLV